MVGGLVEGGEADVSAGEGDPHAHGIAVHGEDVGLDDHLLRSVREHLGRQVAHVELALELEFETVGTVERGAVGVIRIHAPRIRGGGRPGGPPTHRGDDEAGEAFVGPAQSPDAPVRATRRRNGRLEP